MIPYRITWDGVGSRFYKAGLDHGVLYLFKNGVYCPGVAWNGLTGVDDGSSGHDKTLLYTADRRSAVVFSPKEYGGTIKCFTYPDEFEECIGNEQIADGLFAQESDGIPFGFSYRTKTGNDVDSNFGYIIHIVYNAYVTDAKEDASTIGENAEIGSMSFGFEAIPEAYSGHDPCSHFKVDSRFVLDEKLEELERILYGSDEYPPRLPLPDELYDILYVPYIPDVPEEWDYYPHDYRYPSDDAFPMVEFPPISLLQLDVNIRSSDDVSESTLSVMVNITGYVPKNPSANTINSEIQVDYIPGSSYDISDTQAMFPFNGTYRSFLMGEWTDVNPSGQPYVYPDDLSFRARYRTIETGTVDGIPFTETSDWSKWSETVIPVVPNRN